MGKLLAWFKDVGKEDVGLVGGKGANLGEMTQEDFPVPPGFIVTTTAYYDFLKENGLEKKITHLLGTADFANVKTLEKTSLQIKKLIVGGKMSEKLIEEIFDAYTMLSGPLKNMPVAVRSSATAEDLPNASFAGQQETFLNVTGEANLLLRIKDAWASLFDTRAIFYRHQQKFDHFKIGIAIPVQKMVNATSSGIMFSIDPVTNDKTKIVIEAIWGLGELIVQGEMTPDHYEVSKADGKILNKKIAQQNMKLIGSTSGNKMTPVPTREQSKQKITDEQILILANLAKKLEHHYYFPQDSEWAIENGIVYVVQTRAVTTVGNVRAKKSEFKTENTSSLPLLLTGDPASPGIASGPVKIIHSASEIDNVFEGDVLVAPQTNPDYVPAMKKAVAIITDKGGRTAHAAIVSRELGIPAVVGTGNSTKVLKTGEVVTVNGGKGEIYKGGHFTKVSADYSIEYIPTATKVYVNLAQPDLAEKTAQKNADGVGLLRAEFIMANIGVHPKKMIQEKKSQEYIDRLAEDIAIFCKAFSPRPVVYRTSDFKTNEYHDLIGGKEFEPEEPNPMLGYRGAFRYISDPEVFHLELAAIKKVRETMGLKNLWMMIPFVRTVDELIQVKKIIHDAGLYRSTSFKLWMMVEIPANVILLEEFIKAGIDGVSIGSNDLTMLVLGTDRDNSEVAPEFDELNPAVLWAIEHVIKIAHKEKITVSLCGQAPSQHPHMLEKLVSWGITSVSVSPDVIDTTRATIAHIEKSLIT